MSPAGLALLAWRGSTLSGHSGPISLEPGADPFLSLLAADFAFLCNGASEDSERGAELRERPRYEYAPGLEDPHYGLPSPDMGPYYNYLESEYGNPDAGFPRREPNSEYHGRPLHHGPGRSPPRYLPSQTGEYWETQRGAFPPSLCPRGLPGSSHPGQGAPGLEQALLLAALSRSWPHRHRLAACPPCPLHSWVEDRPGLTPPCPPPGLYEGFEGLQAEECGILNGCENGRCVRVREGYTCDCFDGFQLDMTRMACVGEWRPGPAPGLPGGAAGAVRAAGPPRSLPAAALWRCWPGQLAEESRLLLALPSHRPATTILEVQPATFCWQLGEPLMAPFA